MSVTHEAAPANAIAQSILVLASQSPQRLALLQQLGFAPVCLPAHVDETPQAQESPRTLVQRLAQGKAHACAAQNGFSQHNQAAKRYVVVAADTVIDRDGEILGKPSDQTHAINMLLSLSGREHDVHSGICVFEPDNGTIQTRVITTRVRLGAISADTAFRYWQTGEPWGKAGSYAIQGLGAQFVLSLSGSYSNVVGLPLFEITELLERAGVPSLRLVST